MHIKLITVYHSKKMFRQYKLKEILTRPCEGHHRSVKKVSHHQLVRDRSVNSQERI